MRNKTPPLLPAASTPNLTVSVPGQVVRTEIWGEPVFFTITNPGDSIQKHQAAGQFYETEELEIIRRWCPPGAIFADIGANIGNHSLFVAKFLRPAKIILFEPNPDAIAILRSNLGLNGVLAICDLSCLGYGLSDSAHDGLTIEVPSERNLGGARLVSGKSSGTLSVRPGDDFLRSTAPTFLKIDVEGMEMSVLAGLEATITRYTPTIFIEIQNENRAAFDAWVAAHHYVIKANFRRYKSNENFLIVPDTRADAG